MWLGWGSQGLECVIRPGVPEAGVLSGHRRAWGPVLGGGEHFSQASCRPSQAPQGAARGGRLRGKPTVLSLAGEGWWAVADEVLGFFRWDACSSWHLHLPPPSGGHQGGLQAWAFMAGCIYFGASARRPRGAGTSRAIARRSSRWVSGDEPWPPQHRLGHLPSPHGLPVQPERV